MALRHPPRARHALIAAVSLTVCGCADRGYETHSITYEYAAPDRAAAERSARQSAQDECYIEGDTYAQLAGPPHVVSGTTGAHVRATQYFYCIGMRGEG